MLRKESNKYIKKISKRRIAFVLFIILNLLFLVAYIGLARESVSLNIGDINLEDYLEVVFSVNFSEEITEKLDNSSFEVYENGKRVTDIKVSLSGEGRLPVNAVLVVDSSGSMQGEPLEEAKKASKTFISQMGKEDKAGIVQVGSLAKILVSPTSSKEPLLTKIDKMKIEGDTALYDGIIKGLRLFSTSGAERNVLIVLSDGKDTVSKANYSDIKGPASEFSGTIYTIGLGKGELSEEQLEELAEVTNGKYFKAPTASELQKLYDSLAEEIYSGVTIAYTSRVSRGELKDLKVNAFIGNKTISAEKKIKVSSVDTSPGKEEAAKDTKYPLVADSPYRLLIFTLIASFLSVFLFILVLFSIFTPDRDSVSQRLKVYERAWKSHSDVKEETEPAAENFKDRILQLIDVVAIKQDFHDAIANKIEQAGFSLRVSEFVFFHFVFIIVFGIVGNIILGFIGLVLFALIGAFIPFAYLERQRLKREEKFEEQLPDMLIMIAGSLRAGYSLLQAIDLASRQYDPPISTEFERAVKETRLGLSIHRALENMVNRVKNQSLEWTVTAMSIQKEVGGNLAEVLDKLADTLLKRQAFKGHVKALSAEGRISATILIILPIVEALVIYLVNPDYIKTLFETSIGIILVVVASVMMITGWFWMKRIITIDF